MRRRGIRALVFRGASAHGHRLEHPLHVVGVGADGVTLAVRRLVPGRVVRIRRAVWLLELPIGCAAPPIGVALGWRYRDSGAGIHRHS